MADGINTLIDILIGMPNSLQHMTLGLTPRMIEHINTIMTTNERSRQFTHPRTRSILSSTAKVLRTRIIMLDILSNEQNSMLFTELPKKSNRKFKIYYETILKIEYWLGIKIRKTADIELMIVTPSLNSNSKILPRPRVLDYYKI